MRTGNQRRAGTAFGAEGAALFLSLSAPQAQVRAPRATPRGGLVGVGAHVHLVAVEVAKVDVGTVATVRAAGHTSDAAARAVVEYRARDADEDQAPDARYRA